MNDAAATLEATPVSDTIAPAEGGLPVVPPISEAVSPVESVDSTPVASIDGAAVTVDSSPTPDVPSAAPVSIDANPSPAAEVHVDTASADVSSEASVVTPDPAIPAESGDSAEKPALVLGYPDVANTGPAEPAGVDPKPEGDSALPAADVTATESGLGDSASAASTETAEPVIPEVSTPVGEPTQSSVDGSAGLTFGTTAPEVPVAPDPISTVSLEQRSSVTTLSEDQRIVTTPATAMGTPKEEPSWKAALNKAKGLIPGRGGSGGQASTGSSGAIPTAGPISDAKPV
jgi:hypothetical protein